MKVTDKITITNEDNMLLMARYPDNYFDLAIVDPPYKNEFVIAASDNASKVKRNGNLKTLNNNVPTNEYFTELKRVSKNQIIWGVNYYEIYLGAGRIVWDKDNTGVYSDCELAYHSFSDVTRKFKWRWNGMLQQDMKNKETRIHPTQKPRQLYNWLLDKYANDGDKILDTHLGSGSIALACHNRGFELTACELDKDYYNAAIKRIKNHTAQTSIFDFGA
jgi:site-specific DNA-methyltransferase (adenine-specific)